MREPVAVDPGHLFDFIGRPELTVVFVSVHAAHTFNPALSHYLEGEGAEEIVCGTVDFKDLILFGGPAIPFLHEGLGACGAPSDFGVLPGYWLFRRGEVLAWDLGLPRFGDAKALAHSALLGALWSGLTRNLAFVGQALRSAAEDITARRLALGFREVASDRAAHRRAPPRQEWSSADELARAYQTLGVSPSVSDQEVQAAWRKRRIELHPDRAAHDPDEFERLSRLSAELNRARDVVMNHRARTGRRHTA